MYMYECNMYTVEMLLPLYTYIHASLVKCNCSCMRMNYVLVALLFVTDKCSGLFHNFELLLRFIFWFLVAFVTFITVARYTAVCVWCR